MNRLSTNRVTRLLLAGLIGIMALLMTGPSPSAYADPPTIIRIAVDQERPSPFLTQECGFPVTYHNEGTVRIITHYDGQGNVVREIHLAQENMTVSANGRSIRGRANGPGIITPNPDGSITLESMGNYMFTLPGYGVVEGGAGRSVYNIVFEPEFQITLVSEVGTWGENIPAMCAALAP